MTIACDSVRNLALLNRGMNSSEIERDRAESMLDRAQSQLSFKKH